MLLVLFVPEIQANDSVRRSLKIAQVSVCEYHIMYSCWFMHKGFNNKNVLLCNVPGSRFV